MLQSSAMEVPARPYARYTLFAILLLIGYLAYRVLKPFLGLLAVAGSFAILLSPLHARLSRRLGGRGGVAAALLVVGLSLILLGPLLTYGAILGEQAASVLEWARPHLTTAEVQRFLGETLPQRFPWVQRVQEVVGLDDQRVAELGAPALSRVLAIARTLIQAAVRGLATALLQIVLFLVLLFFLLRDGQLLVRQMRELSPLSDTQELALFDHLGRTIKGSLLATVLVPIVQGVLAMIGFTLFGVPEGLFWGAMLIVSSLIPGLGATLVWAPCALYLFLVGRTGAAIGLTFYGALLISTIDNLIKPVLLRQSAQIHPLLGFMASLGGVLAFGVMGFLIGPVVLSLLLSALRIYRDQLDVRAAPPGLA